MFGTLHNTQPLGFTSLKADQLENLTLQFQIIISAFNFEVRIKTFLSLCKSISDKQCGIFVKFEEKTNVFRVCLSGLHMATDW